MRAAKLDKVNKIRLEMEICNGDYDAAACGKWHNNRFDCLCPPEDIQQLQENGIEDPGKGIRILMREMDVAISIGMLALNEDTRY